ncbi:MAG TPA: sigma-70 family RNA polymerase sigma factor [Chitinophaga sp.]|uniref:RNA polymerase sigma factor n=1 Tax=Chitinophaga sp. TaxID=1869181 RepID=UPI002CFB3F49|nr:sigma-70 family RNA polymerase sigma factor [Chitinophaga sp.]HVI45260.1 sigma-70 family RNA polymerase sigma factor [Chitinophaga sp.]
MAHQQEERLRRIIDQTYDKLYGVLNMLCKDHDLCADLVQQTYIKVWKNLDAIDDDESIMALLKTYGRHLFLDEIRKQTREEAAMADYKPDEATPSPEDMFLQRELGRQIQSTISKLPTQQQKIFRLHKEQSLSYRQISSQLDISTGTIEKQMNRALKFLRKELGR